LPRLFYVFIEVGNAIWLAAGRVVLLLGTSMLGAQLLRYPGALRAI